MLIPSNQFDVGFVTKRTSNWFEGIGIFQIELFVASFSVISLAQLFVLVRKTQTNGKSIELN